MNMSGMGQINKELLQKGRDMSLLVECGSAGVVNTELAIVSEAPGRREVETKQPLSGESGKLLFSCLAKYGGYQRFKMYTTNVIKKRMLYETGKQKINQHELTNYEGLLMWELLQLPYLKYILVCGGYALKAVTGRDGIMKWRGSVIPADKFNRYRKNYCERVGIPYPGDVYCLATYNPAMCIREPKTEVVFRMDIAKFHKLVIGEWKPYEMNYRINPSYSEVMRWIERMHDEREPVSLDIESIGGHTACVGLANDPHDGMCVAFRGDGVNFWSVNDEARIWRRLQSLGLDENVRFVTQNGNFDMTWLWFKEKLRLHRVWFDTLLAHHTLYSQLPHNLGFLVSQYTTHPFYKDEKDGFRQTGDIDTFWEYNVKDVCLTLAVQQKLDKELEKEGMHDFFFNHVMRLQPHLARMTVGGVLVDRELKAKLNEEIGGEVKQLEQRFYDKVHEAFPAEPEYNPNPNSPKQLKELFFDRLKLVGHGQSTDNANKARMLQHARTGPKAVEIIEAHTLYKQYQKFFSTYVETALDEDGRMRCEYRQFGTQSAPGRLSSAQTLWGSGGNMQNQPERAYPMFIADEGYCFVYFDLSQAEARLVAWLAKITSWQEQFERARVSGGYDCHRALAADMFNTPYDDIPTFDRYDASKSGMEPPEGTADRAPTIRYIAKRCRHGLNYRMNWPKLAEVTGLSMKLAHHAYSVYHQITPELRDWWELEEREARKTRKLISPKGRRIVILERITDEALESIIAFKPQSTIGDHVCEVIYRCHEDERWPEDARIAINVHDALIALVPIAKAEQVAVIMKQHAEQPIYVEGEPVIIPAEFKVSVPDEQGIHRWSKMQPMNVLNT